LYGRGHLAHTRAVQEAIIRKMKVNEEMSFWDRLYIPALIKGMFTTLKHIPNFTGNLPET
jgi:hypothetical protein